MRRILLITIAAMVVELVTSGQGAVPSSAPAGADSTLPNKAPTGGNEGLAEDLRLSGKCDKAVPILRRLVESRGFAISRYNLGKCLLTLSEAEADASKAATMRKEAATMIVQAANAGLAQAEAEAVSVFLDGLGADKDPVQAEKWALIYRHNGLRLALGLPGLSQDVSDRLDAALSDSMRTLAETQAKVWTPASPEPEY
ncbi:MAG: hypothetical protein ABSD74_18730 [Rhizomicrobium sp.]|jgi:hypothetical protein